MNAPILAEGKKSIVSGLRYEMLTDFLPYAQLPIEADLADKSASLSGDFWKFEKPAPTAAISPQMYNNRPNGGE